jgi:hypothetical protein
VVRFVLLPQLGHSPVIVFALELDSDPGAGDLAAGSTAARRFETADHHEVRVAETGGGMTWFEIEGSTDRWMMLGEPSDDLLDHARSV